MIGDVGSGNHSSNDGLHQPPATQVANDASASIYFWNEHFDHFYVSNSFDDGAGFTPRHTRVVSTPFSAEPYRADLRGSVLVCSFEFLIGHGAGKVGTWKMLKLAAVQPAKGAPGPT